MSRLSPRSGEKTARPQRVLRLLRDTSRAGTPLPLISARQIGTGSADGHKRHEPHRKPLIGDSPKALQASAWFFDVARFQSRSDDSRHVDLVAVAASRLTECDDSLTPGCRQGLRAAVASRLKIRNFNSLGWRRFAAEGCNAFGVGHVTINDSCLRNCQLVLCN